MTEQLPQLIYLMDVDVFRMIPIQSLLLISVAKKFFRVIFDYTPINEDELTLKVGDIVEFLGHESKGWYKGQLKGETGVFPFNYVEECPPSSAPSSAPTTDGTQLSSVSLSETHPDKPLVPISEEGGAAANPHEDPTPPTSAGETRYAAVYC